MYVHVSTCIYLKFAAASDEEAGNDIMITGMDTKVIQVHWQVQSKEGIASTGHSRIVLRQLP